MKKILFVMNDLNCGGSQKSLISLLENIDYTKYEVDLFLFSHEGMFMNSIPKEVNLLDEPEDYKYFDMSIKKAVKELIHKRKLKVLFNRLLSIFIYKTEKDRTRLEQRIWKFLKSSLPSLNKKYDAVIGYQEKNPIYYVVEKTISDKKIGWIHTDYSQININHKYEEKYFNKLSNIVTVSEKLVEILKEEYKGNKDKILCIENIISPTSIRKLANEDTDICFDKNYINIISMGRIVDAKGYDIAIKACKRLLDKGKKIRWYVIGEGGMKGELINLSKELKVEDKFIFIGARENPYSYISKGDIYVQSSKFEGKSIAVEEAKILCKPIVITDFSSATNHIRNNVNGLITKKDPIELAESIIQIIENEDLRKMIINNLSNSNLGNKDEVNKLYSIIS